MTRALAVLVVEDSEDDALLLVRELERGGYTVASERVQTAEAMANALHRGGWDLVVADYFMPGFSGRAALEVLKGSALDLPFIMLSGMLREEDAVEALRAGAYDFVVKGRMARLLPAVERALRESQLRRRHREVQARLAQTEKLQALGQLAAGIAHDLRNIFTPLILHTQRLRRRLTHPQALATLDTIDRVLHVGVEVVGRLDLFSRKRDDAAHEPVALQAVARSIVELCDHRTRPRPRVRLQIEEVTPAPEVRAPLGELTSALLNLVVNALDAVGSAGTVCVRTGAADGGAFVEVADDGPGMPPEVQRRLYEPFFTTKDGGTGLGLSIVRAFVTRQGGQVTVDTGPDHGTCVRMWFPASASNEAHAPPSPEQAMP